MKTLLKSVLILDNRSKYHGKKRDILIEDGKIKTIQREISEKTNQVINEKSAYVSPGWMDMRANFCDPGYEIHEDIDTGLRAAQHGGFKSVLLMPSTLPSIDNKSQIEYLLSKSESYPIQLLICGALSDKMAQKQLSEMYDMHMAGAVAFTDDKLSVSTELLTQALEYSKNFDGLIVTFPLDRSVNPGAQINESATSASLGIKGFSNLSEELCLSRDIELLKYCGGRMHVSLISTAGSVELIRKAKKASLPITCSIAAHQLFFRDSDLAQFDSNLKVLPPLRGDKDIEALKTGLKDGTIDCICSDHTPVNVEHKEREFEDADFGISSIESAFNMAWAALRGSLEIEEVISKFTTGPAKILGLHLPVIEQGAEANITVFSPEGTTTFSNENWISKSKNTSAFGKTFPGKVIAVI